MSKKYIVFMALLAVSSASAHQRGRGGRGRVPECQLKSTDLALHVGPPAPGKKFLYLRGGGWEPNGALNDFLKLRKPADQAKPIAMVLSATSLEAGKLSPGKMLDFYQGLAPNENLIPLFTRTQGFAAQGLNPDPNAAENVKKIADAGAIIISGGYPPELKHLSGTQTATQIKKSYEQGVPVYGNSAALSIIGNFFAWDIASNRGETNTGLGVIPAAVTSHVNDWNKYNAPDMWQLVPAKSKLGIGMMTDTVAVVENDELIVTSGAKVYIFNDEKFPPTPQCSVYFIIPGQSYNLKTGVVRG